VSVQLPPHSDVRLLARLDQERIFILLDDLREFHDTYIFYRVIRATQSAPATVTTFLFMALRSSLHGLYLTDPQEAVIPMLRSIGRDDLADRTERILETPVEGMSYREALSHLRNKLVAHRRYQLASRSNASSPVLKLSVQAQVRIGMFDDRLMRRTAALYRYMTRLFPEFDDLQRGRLTEAEALQLANARPLARKPKGHPIL
jgi:hypothetical protein